MSAETRAAKLKEDLIAYFLQPPDPQQSALFRPYNAAGKPYQGKNVLRLLMARPKDVAPVRWVDNPSTGKMAEMPCPNIWGTFKGWQAATGCSIRKGEKSPASVVFQGPQAIKDEEGKPVLDVWGEPLNPKWRTQTYSVFHCSQVDGFDLPGWCERHEAAQRYAAEMYEKKLKDARATYKGPSYTDFRNFILTQVVEDQEKDAALLERIILAYLEGEGVGLEVGTFASRLFFEENRLNWGAYCHPPYDAIVMRDPEAYERDWHPLFRLEVLVHEAIHSTQFSNRTGRRITEEELGNDSYEECVAYFGTLLMFTLFSLESHGLASVIWTDVAEEHADHLRDWSDAAVSSLLEDAERAVNYIFSVAMEDESLLPSHIRAVSRPTYGTEVRVMQPALD